LVATGKSPRLGLSTEFTRWKQRLDPKNAASTGMKPVESHGPSLRLVATNYRPTGIKPVVANRRKKCLTALPKRGEGEKTRWGSKSIGISGLACGEMWVKMRRLAHGFTSALAPRFGNPTCKRVSEELTAIPHSRVGLSNCRQKVVHP
jgi:hypothetical protein